MQGRLGARVKLAQEEAPAAHLLLGDGAAQKWRVGGRGKEALRVEGTTGRVEAGRAWLLCSAPAAAAVQQPKRGGNDDAGCAGAVMSRDNDYTGFGVGRWSASRGRVAGCDTVVEEGARA
jgi:hypothetical protein